MAILTYYTDTFNFSVHKSQENKIKQKRYIYDTLRFTNSFFTSNYY